MAASSARGHEQSTTSTDELLQGHLELWHHALGYVKSAALQCAMELRIPDAIVLCGGAATLDDLLNATELPQSNLPCLHRLMRALTASRIFAVRHGPAVHVEGTVREPAASVPVYELTAASRLLVTVGEASSFSQFPAIYSLVNRNNVSFMLGMHDWIKHERATTMSLFKVAYGKELWEILETDASLRAGFYEAMDADTRLIMHAVVSESPAVFQGLTSLVDVGGGRGAAVAAIARAFPHIKCTVMDLPHVVAQAPTDGAAGSGPCFVTGDMFQHIPPADALLLKWVLHDWDDDNCIKILRQCKQAIAHKDTNAKVIIIDAVIGYKENDVICKEAQVLFDLQIMGATNGVEREEHEWRRIFVEAGFSDYKITPIRGVRSVIEVYP